MALKKQRVLPDEYVVKQGDDGKTVNAVLDKDGKEVFKTGDAKTAMQYLAKNFDKLKNPVKESNPELDRIKSLSFYQ